MAFAGVQFDESDGGSVALVCSSWLTPRKTELFWPPYKTQNHYNKALKKCELPCESWTTYKVSRIFFSSDSLPKAQHKLRQLEYTSDVQTDDAENDYVQAKRPRIAPRRLYDSDSSDDDNNDSQTNKQLLARPPALSKTQLQKSSSQAAVLTEPQSTSLKLHSIINVTDNTQCMTPTCSATSTSSQESIPNLNKSIRVPVHDDKLLSILLFVKEQNKQILALLNKKSVQPGSVPVLQEFPVNFPLKNYEDLSILEAHLKDKDNCDALASYLSSFGGKGLVSRVNIILKHCLSNILASNYSFCGKRTKKSFSGLALKDVIIPTDAV